MIIYFEEIEEDYPSNTPTRYEFSTDKSDLGSLSWSMDIDEEDWQEYSEKKVAFENIEAAIINKVPPWAERNSN